jgi:hypothetical protein
LFCQHTAAERRQAEGLPALRPKQLEPNLAATHGTPDSAEDPQNHTDDHQDAPNGVENSYAGEITDQQQNNA